MIRSIQINRNLVIFGIPIGLLLILILLIKSALPNNNGAFSFAITADLLLTVPFIYFLLIRKSGIPKTTVIPVMVLGLLIGAYFLPKESQTYLNLFKNCIFPVIELFVLGFVIWKARKAIHTYKKLKGASPDFYDNLKNVCNEILPKKLAIPFATEIAVFYYGFIHWKTRQPHSNEFTYHLKTGSPALFGGFIMILGIETFVLHILLAKWSPLFAWILTGLSFYTIIQIFGFAKSLYKRPIAIEENMLILRYGIMSETQISLDTIESVVLSKKELVRDKLTKTLSPLGELEGHNVVLHLKQENSISGVYGIKSKYKVIGLHVDEPHDFKEKVENAMQKALF